MQVDCAWCVASHDRQSPHFYALCDAPFQAPTFGRGFFLFARGSRQTRLLARKKDHPHRGKDNLIGTKRRRL